MSENQQIMMPPPAILKIKPADAKFYKGNYEWVVTKASYFESHKNPDRIWKALRVDMQINSGKLKGWPSSLFLQLPDEEDEQWYRTNLLNIVKFASACAGAPLDDDFEIEFVQQENGEYTVPSFVGSTLWAYNDVDNQPDGRQFVKWDLNKLYFTNPETTSEDQPY